MKLRNLALALAAGAAITVAAVAQAHPEGRGGYGPGMMGGGYGPGMMGGGHGPGMMGAGFGPGPNRMGRGADPEARLAQFKIQLKITPAQEGAWEAFSAKSKQQGESMRAAHEAIFASMQDPKLTTPERAALRSAMMKQRVGEMESMATAIKDLYAALTPEQRAIIDQGPAARRGRR